jgi:hypothetical protein
LVSGSCSATITGPVGAKALRGFSADAQEVLVDDAVVVIDLALYPRSMRRPEEARRSFRSTDDDRVRIRGDQPST